MRVDEACVAARCRAFVLAPRWHGRQSGKMRMIAVTRAAEVSTEESNGRERYRSRFRHESHRSENRRHFRYSVTRSFVQTIVKIAFFSLSFFIIILAEFYSWRISFDDIWTSRKTGVDALSPFLEYYNMWFDTTQAHSLLVRTTRGMSAPMTHDFL